jgi:RNA polymerase sigma-70 factor (ECF subfamily)
MEPTQRKSIHEAMVRLSDGDRSAFPVLVDDLWPVILAFARRGVGHQQDAEDIAQEVFVRICSRIADFDRARDGVAWALGIAAYEILTVRRRQQRRREQGGLFLDHYANDAATPEDSLIRQELAAAVTHAIGQLSNADRVSLGLVAEPAAVIVEGPTLRKRRQRALDRLRAVWRNLHGEP